MQYAKGSFRHCKLFGMFVMLNEIQKYAQKILVLIVHVHISQKNRIVQEKDDKDDKVSNKLWFA